MLAPIKYRYALDGEKLVEAVPSQVVRGKEYSCLSCGNSVVPVMGDVRQKHFRHKVQMVCSPETYLHNLAKKAFYEKYSECLNTQLPYFISYRVPVRCNACKDHGPCEIGHELRRIDLAKHFKEIVMEARDGEFIPDILLKYGSEKLYIEIAVTHFIEPDKAAFGTRIIEISIANERDIDLITSCDLSEDDVRITVENFRRTPADGNCADQCQETVNCFILYTNSKSKLCTIPVPEYEMLVNNPFVVYVEKTSAYGPEAYVDKVAEHFKQGRKIRNCWLCKSHCLNYKTRTSYCQGLKVHIENGNRASDCRCYKPITSIPEGGLFQQAKARLHRHKSTLSDTPPTDGSAGTVAPLKPRSSSITYFGLSLVCTGCQTVLKFIALARFAAESGRIETVIFLDTSRPGDPRYSRVKLERFLSTTTVLDHPTSIVVGVLVRYQGKYHIQCPDCKKLNHLTEVEYVPLFSGHLEGV